MADNSFAVNVPAHRAFEGCTLVVNITGLRTLRARLWFGIQVLKIAALIMGVGFRIEVEDA